MRGENFMRKTSVVVCTTLLLFTAGLIGLSAQQPVFPGTRGLDVSPTYDGWEHNPDDTFTMYFSYYNRNTQEDVDVPIGPDNHFDLGSGDEGQPTHFYPGRKWWLFKVVVPKDWPKDKRVVWTLTSNGRTNLAKGWLEPEWEVERAGIILGGYRNRALPGELDKLPKISIMGGPPQIITLPATATLTAMATATSPGCEVDAQGRCATGIDLKRFQIRWIVYRGAGKVQFDPEVGPSANGKSSIASEPKVTFSMPGNYRFRAIATDGSSFANYDVDVKVNPGPSADKAR